ncbi:MAG: deoxyhypusine synthase [Thermoplasmata archaeon HGW-Thermoplasmata-1]|nr:MAG: deoxyhypusine synthase [Thermoplasmata archaeon HGW-Thermoplasmata-1]
MKTPTRDELLSTPVRQIDFDSINTVSELVEAMKHSSIQSRNIGKCVSVYENMLENATRPTIIMGLSGALIAGGMRKIIRDMIERGIVDCLVSTGAIMYQDFYQALGHNHYRGHPEADNLLLREHFIDRIYDTYVDEGKFRETDSLIGTLTEELEPRGYSTREFLFFLGKKAAERDPNSILGTAYRHGVPIFVPALNDSSIGIGLTEYYARNKGKPKMTIDPIRDNYELTQVKAKSGKTGVIYVGGGTPKNYINDVEVIAEVLGYGCEGHEYAFQITSATPHDGGLSGSTLDEAQSWGKLHREATKATVYVEATIGLPLIAGSVLQRMRDEGYLAGRKRVKFVWDGDEIEEVKLV